MSDTDFTLLEVADAPPHEHPEHRYFGQRGFAQTLPTYATATLLPRDSVPHLLAVQMTLPAGRECVGVSVATGAQGGFVAGTWRAGIYDTTSGRNLPLGVTNSAPADKNPWWYAPMLQPIAAADQTRTVWVVLETGQAEGMSLLVHKPLHAGLLPNLSFSKLEGELPVQFSFDGWESNTLIPIIALS